MWSALSAQQAVRASHGVARISALTAWFSTLSALPCCLVNVNCPKFSWHLRFSHEPVFLQQT